MKNNKKKPPQLRRVLVVYKRSVYQKYVLEQGHTKLRELLRKKDLSTRQILKAHERHTKTLESIIHELDALGLKYDAETRHHIRNLDGYDLIITVGGDGTFLRTSHHVKDQLIIGINSAPQHSVGATCAITHDKFPQKIRDIIAGNFNLMRLTRIESTLNGKKLPLLATNDILFCNISAAATSRYFIKRGKIIEDHKSSGVWISTPLGSTAVISAAGGERRPLIENSVQFIAREPYQGIYDPYKLKHGFIEGRERLQIISKMIHASIYIDGPMHFYDLHYGDVVSFGISKHKLRVIR